MRLVPLRVSRQICNKRFPRATATWRHPKMSEVAPARTVYSEMSTKLISAGYLRPEQRHDPDAITHSCDRVRHTKLALCVYGVTSAPADPANAVMNQPAA